jgi:hypothetical protein
LGSPACGGVHEGFDNDRRAIIQRLDSDAALFLCSILGLEPDEAELFLKPQLLVDGQRSFRGNHVVQPDVYHPPAFLKHTPGSFIRKRGQRSFQRTET